MTSPYGDFVLGDVPDPVLPTFDRTELAHLKRLRPTPEESTAIFEIKRVFHARIVARTPEPSPSS